MKKIILLSLIVLLTSFKDYQTEFTYINFDYELKYLFYNKESSVFVSKTNSKDFLRYDGRAESFALLRNDEKYNIIFSNNEIDYNLSHFEPNRGFFTKIFETKETKVINNLVCTKYIEKSSSEPEPKDVFISKNHKINNTNFLVSMGLKTDVEVKGLVVEINVIKKKTNEIRTILSLKEIKENQKSLKINDKNLNEIAEKFKKLKKDYYDNPSVYYGKNVKNGETVATYVTVEHIDDTESKSLPLKEEKKYMDIAEKNHKYFHFKDGNWNKYAEKNFKFKTKDTIGYTYNFKAYCTISKNGIITKITDVQPEEYKEEYTKFLNSVKDRWVPDEEYGEKIECSYYILTRIVK
ncbi:hypothetical protein L1S34_12205 [Flavobacterium sp. K77]|uniref:hypothetical protein n=1 Tax=Flavobacterium sp. K77 TaxID=2910676 RepID=UPI001F254841|nr:hypothetical protein [Flavobacterium sp. K77]MCF6142051.1 hypothetical protein [Flavobacterium sp. K77]